MRVSVAAAIFLLLVVITSDSVSGKQSLRQPSDKQKGTTTLEDLRHTEKSRSSDYRKKNDRTRNNFREEKRRDKYAEQSDSKGASRLTEQFGTEERASRKFHSAREPEAAANPQQSSRRNNNNNNKEHLKSEKREKSKRKSDSIETFHNSFEGRNANNGKKKENPCDSEASGNPVVFRNVECRSRPKRQNRKSQKNHFKSGYSSTEEIQDDYREKSENRCSRVKSEKYVSRKNEKSKKREVEQDSNGDEYTPKKKSTEESEYAMKHEGNNDVGNLENEREIFNCPEEEPEEFTNIEEAPEDEDNEDEENEDNGGEEIPARIESPQTTCWS